ncbi:hypothetical protein FO512_32345, partial [Bacillus cereus]|nr:hypothetical protein [Bacillus cereus]
TNVGLPALVACSTSSNDDLEELNTTANPNILGGEVPQNQWKEQSISVDKKAEGIVSVLTASSDVEVQMVSPKGKIYENKDSAITT